MTKTIIMKVKCDYCTQEEMVPNITGNQWELPAKWITINIDYVTAQMKHFHQSGDVHRKCFERWLSEKIEAYIE